jgi:hypothetical protein
MVQPLGHGLVRTAFAQADRALLDDLDEAVAAVLRITPSPVVPAWLASIDPRHWPQTRATISAIRRAVPQAVATAPALAGWVMMCAAGAGQTGRSDEPYAVNEALHVLAELRAEVDAPPPALGPGVASAYRGIAAFLDEVFQPALAELLRAPMRIWHRGAVGYLRAGRGSGPKVVAIVSRYLAETADDEPASGERDWFEYARAEAVNALADLDALTSSPSKGRRVEGTPQIDHLLWLAEHHPDAEIRAGALDALAAAMIADDRVQAVALRAATESDDVQERAAAVLLLAGLA